MTQLVDHPSRGETIVVVPCFNEAGRLDVRAYDEFLDRFPGILLLLVDDGSTDDTPLVLERLRHRHPQQISALRLHANSGKAEAVRRGVLVALRRRPAMVGYWDADLATPLEIIPRFEAVLRDRPELSLVMGSRVALLGRQIRRHWHRHMIGRAFATAASLALSLSVYDTQCGAKLFRVTSETGNLFGQPFRTRWIFDVEILARFIAASRSLGQRPADELIYEYPLERWQDVKGSRLKPLDFFIAGIDLAAIHWRYAIRGASMPAVQRDVAHPLPSTEHRDAA